MEIFLLVEECTDEHTYSYRQTIGTFTDAAEAIEKQEKLAKEFPAQRFEIETWKSGEVRY